MKRNILLTIAALLSLSSCGVMVSSSSQRFQDDIYLTVNDRKQVSEEVNLKYFEECEGFKGFDELNNVYVFPGVGCVNIYQPFASGGFGICIGGGYRVWAYDPWYRPWGPWNYDPWFYDPWFYDPWYRPWGPWGPYDPWYRPWGPWGPYDPWYRPWGPWGPYRPYPWYPGRYYNPGSHTKSANAGRHGMSTVRGGGSTISNSTRGGSSTIGGSARSSVSRTATGARLAPTRSGSASRSTKSFFNFNSQPVRSTTTAPSRGSGSYTSPVRSTSTATGTSTTYTPSRSHSESTPSRSTSSTYTAPSRSTSSYSSPSRSSGSYSSPSRSSSTFSSPSRSSHGGRR